MIELRRAGGNWFLVENMKRLRESDSFGLVVKECDKADISSMFSIGDSELSV